MKLVFCFVMILNNIERKVLDELNKKARSIAENLHKVHWDVRGLEKTLEAIVANTIGFQDIVLNSDSSGHLAHEISIQTRKVKIFFEIILLALGRINFIASEGTTIFRY